MDVSWSSYEKLRGKLLKNFHIDSLLHLGPHAFDEIGGEVVQSATFVIANRKPSENGGIYYRLVDGSNSNMKEKIFLRRENEYSGITQHNFQMIPSFPIGYWAGESILDDFTKLDCVEKHAYARVGMFTGDNNRFLKDWWEISASSFYKNCTSYIDCQTSDKKWYPYNKGGSSRRWYGNYELVVNYQHGGYEIYELKKEDGRNCQNYPDEYKFQPCITWSTAAVDAFRLQKGGVLFDTKGMCMFTKHLLPLLAYVNSKVAKKFLEILSPGVDTQVGHIRILPFNINYQSCVIDEITNINITISRQDWDSHETSWDFQTNELLTIDDSNWQNILNDYSVQAGIFIDPAPANPASLEWRMSLYKMKWEAKFRQLHSNEEELNRQFIAIYGLQDELTPDVPLSEITILQKGEISIENNEIVWHEDIIIKQLISYLVGCFMGRYSIDKPGLIIASQHKDLNTLGLKVEGIDNNAPGRLAIDDDGIVPVIEEEDFFDDDMTQRIEQAIKVIFGEENYHANLKYINEKLGKPLREYLFKDFFADHIDGKMYQKRPIYWLFSSKMGEKKKKGYFKALIYMHRMEPDTLSKLHADYVRPYLNKIERQLTEAEDQTTRDDLTQAQRNKALKSVEELRDKVREVHAFEQQLVEMASHRLSIDLDDGVRVNYLKYYPLVEPIKGLDKDE
jgi:hypothetical protein